MIIDLMSKDFKIHIKTTNSLLYANIEIRKKGIIIRIPFNKLQRMDDDDEAVEFANNFVELLEGVWGDSWISQDHLKQ